MVSPTPLHRSLATRGRSDLCLRRAQESGRTLEKYQNDVGCGHPGFNLTNIKKLRMALMSSCTAFARRYSEIHGVLQGCSRCTCFTRSTVRSTSEARGNYEAMANTSFTAFYRALGNIGKCNGTADSRELGGGALSKGCPRVGDGSRPRRGTLLLTSERT